MSAYAVVLISAAGAGNIPDNALLDFTATWCGPCQQMAPVVSDLKRKGHPVVKIDIDANPALARRYGVRSIPAFLLVVNGKVVERKVGYTSRRSLLRMLAKIPKPIAKTRPATSTPVARTAPRKRDRNRFRLPLPGFLKPKKKKVIASNRSEQPVFRGNLDTPDKPIEPTGIPQTAGVQAATPMDASVRIRVRDGRGSNFGSGTVIRSRPGESIVLTCGHVFRDLTANGRIEVDVFSNGEPTTYTGTLIKYDMKADVGLMSLKTPRPIPVIDIATAAHAPKVGDSIVSIGCGGGSKPSRMRGRVTTLNRYLGPDNLECTGTPQQGRSGGGLFDRDGRLIGVCFAADPPRKCGLYAGLKAIRKIIDDAGLKLNAGKTNEALASSSALEVDRSQLDRMATSTPSNGDSGDNARAFEKALAALNAKNRLPAGVGRSEDDNAQSLKTVDELFGSGGEAEVICIIRPLDDPRAESRVVVINRASSQFVRYLRGELNAQPRTTAKYQAERESKAAERPKFADDGELVTPFRAVTATRRPSPHRYRRSAASR